VAGAAHVLLAAAAAAIQLVRPDAHVGRLRLLDVLVGVLEDPHVELVVEPFVVEVALLRGDPVLQTAVR
jgi:hypothetical protein